MLFFAQLIAPPLQEGPVRLPSAVPFERRPAAQPSPKPILSPGLQPPVPPTQTPPGQSETAPLDSRWRPPVNGTTPYKPEELGTILRNCGRATAAETLTACAATLTSRLIKDGYVNTRVFTLPAPAPGALEVVQGRIVELRVKSDDAALASRVRKQLKPLIGTVLHLPSLEQALVVVRSQPGIGQISGNLGRLGSDPTQAVLNLSVDAAATPWLGNISLRNDGNVGTGQWRGVATVLKNNLALRGDTFLTYLELNADGDPELGGLVGSLSYTWPLSDRWTFTSSVGYSQRTLVEAPGLGHDLSFRQFQALGQFETTLFRSSTQFWSAFAGLSANRNDSYLTGNTIPLVFGGGPAGWLRSGYLRAGINGYARLGSVAVGGNVYGLQGISGFSTNEQLSELASFGIEPGQARALGALLNLSWAAGRDVALNLRGAGQLAFAELTNDMGFSIGSDVGLRGLPGSLISGDNGYLGTAELVWTVWRPRNQALQLVPFIGIGGIATTRADLSVSDSVGSGGLLARWLSGRHWAVELGWVEQFSTGDNPGYWSDWLIGSGLYTKVQYRF